MVSCTSFADGVECALSLQNDFNVKATILFFLLIISVLGVWYQSKIEKDSLASLLKFYSIRSLSYTYLSFFLLLILTLRHDVSLEIFITIIVGGYFLVLAIAVGYGLLFAKEKIVDIATQVKRGELGDKLRYSRER